MSPAPIIGRQVALWLILVTLGSCAIAVADPGDAPKQAFTQFLRAFANADIDAMGNSYAAQVTVKRGSTLLKKEYGGLGGDDADQKDKVVERDKLLESYKATIEKLGGEAEWKTRGKDVLRERVIYADHESKVEIKPGFTADRLFEVFGAKEGDVLAIVNPEGDAAVFQLRELGGEWKVVADFWD